MNKCANLTIVTLFAAGMAVAMPTRSELKKVSGVVNEIMSGELQAMKSGKLTPEAAAAKAVGFADGVTDEASKFLLLKGAFGLYVKGAKYDEALATLDRLSREVPNIPDDVMAEIIRNKLKSIPRKNGGAIFERYERIDARLRAANDIRKHEADLKNSENAVIRRQLALCRAMLGDWKKALDDYEKSGGKEGKAASAEKAGKIADAADGWWTCEDETGVLREHAAALYAKVLHEGKLDGLRKVLVEKRMAEVGPVEKADVSGATSQRQSTDEDVRCPSPSSQARKEPTANNDSSIKLPTKSFDLGKGVKMEFIECPAGTFMMGAEPSLWKCEELMNAFPKDKTHPLYPHKVKITRPFWMSKYPITFADFDAVVGGEKYKIAQTAFGDRAIIKYTWPDAEKFTAQLTAKLRSKLPKGYVARFPTEAEFEYAMKGGSHKTDDLHWQWFERHLERDEMRGVVFDSCENLVGQMLENGCSDAKQAKRDGGPWVKYNNLSLLGPAGRYKPNGWGFHDMFLGTLCLGGVAHQQSRVFMYGDQESDPLLYMFPPKYRLVYRPFSRGISMRKRVVADTASSAPHAFRVVIGPDLVKEKGFNKK